MSSRLWLSILPRRIHTGRLGRRQPRSADQRQSCAVLVSSQLGVRPVRSDAWVKTMHKRPGREAKWSRRSGSVGMTRVAVHRWQVRKVVCQTRECADVACVDSLLRGKDASQRVSIGDRCEAQCGQLPVTQMLYSAAGYVAFAARRSSHDDAATEFLGDGRHLGDGQEILSGRAEREMTMPGLLDRSMIGRPHE